MNIRQLSPEDLSLYRHLRMEAVSADSRTLITTPDEERRKEDGDVMKMLTEHCALAAFDGDEALGMATLVRHAEKRRNHVAEVCWVFVSPKHRRRGIAKTLMVAIEEHAKSVDIECIELHVASDNSSAIGMYQQIGYEQYGTLPKAVKIDSSYTDGIYMIKMI